MPDHPPRPHMGPHTLSRSGRHLAIALSVTLLSMASWARAADGQRSGSSGGPLILLPILLVSFVALDLVLWMLATAPLQATCRKVERGRGLCLLTGVVATGVTLALCSTLGKYKGVGELVGALLLGALLLGALVGTMAVTLLLGQGALAMAERSSSRAGVILTGSILFEFVILFPVVGQVLGLYFVLVGLGGALLALMRPTSTGS